MVLLVCVAYVVAEYLLVIFFTNYASIPPTLQPTAMLVDSTHPFLLQLDPKNGA